MEVVKLDEYRGKEVVAALEALLELAREGQIHGVVYVAKLNEGDNRAGMAGIYKRRPDLALQATFMMERRLMHGRPPYAESM